MLGLAGPKLRLTDIQQTRLFTSKQRQRVSLQKNKLHKTRYSSSSKLPKIRSTKISFYFGAEFLLSASIESTHFFPLHVGIHFQGNTKVIKSESIISPSPRYSSQTLLIVFLGFLSFRQDLIRQTAIHVPDVNNVFDYAV